MERSENHYYHADASFDGGDLDCGNGLLLLLRKHLDVLEQGQLLEIRSTDPSVEEDLPAWCRLTKNELVSWTKAGKQRSYLVCKGSFMPNGASVAADTGSGSGAAPKSDTTVPPARHQSAAERHHQSPNVVSTGINLNRSGGASVPPPSPLSVMGIGSWPRPRWLIRSLHEFLQGRITEAEFQETADDAVKLAVSAQIESGADVVTDGEQRRDNYASFVGTRLQNCQLIPLVDLLPMVDDPDDFAAKLDSLDVPADKVRHPAVFGKIARKQPLALHELHYVQTLTSKPVKIALPGPYLLARTMWMECIADKAYDSREALAEDIVRVLREELSDLLAAGAALVQFDEPVLSEVVFSKPTSGSIFMCGALSQKASPAEELEFARSLINAVTEGFNPQRLAVHVCRGNWTPDESAALSGDYRALLPVLTNIQVGTLFLEYCTPRAGELSVLSELPSHIRVGLGVVNPKAVDVESAEGVRARIDEARKYIDLDRLYLNPDCGFATFADNPVTAADTACRKIAVMAEVAGTYRSLLAN